VMEHAVVYLSGAGVIHVKYLGKFAELALS